MIIKCHACDQLIEPTLVFKNLKNEWHIMRCPQCKVAFVHPQPDLETITSYYNGMYSKLASSFDEQKMQWARTSIAGYLSTLERLGLTAGKKLLDLGGGLGYYSKAFGEAGFHVTLVEQDPVSTKFARNVLNLENVIESTVEDYLQTKSEEYDIVFFRHVIEHSTEPAKLIKDVSMVVKGKGILIIETDNNAGVELLFRPGTAAFYRGLYNSSYAHSSFLSLLRKRPFAVDPPRHLFGFRLSNLEAILRKNSLIPIKKVCYRLGHPVYWPNIPLPSLLQVLSNIRHLRFKSIFSDIFEFVVFPLRLLLEKMGLASGICIYAQKQQLSD